MLGWDVSYKEEFVPDDEGSYAIIIQKGKKMGPQEETVHNSFRNSEPGKIVLTIENWTLGRRRFCIDARLRVLEQMMITYE